MNLDPLHRGPEGLTQSTSRGDQGLSGRVVEPGPRRLYGSAMSRTVIEVDRARAEDVVDVFTAAFATDPGMQWMCGPDLARHRAWFRAARDLLFSTPQVVLGTEEDDGRLAGAMVFLDAGVDFALHHELAWAWRMAHQITPRTSWRTLRNFVGGQRFLPREPFVYLLIVGVRPELQGRGHGGALLRALHVRAEHAPGGVQLETEAPDNIPLYEHLGYRQVGVTRLGPVRSVAMNRPAR